MRQSALAACLGLSLALVMLASRAGLAQQAGGIQLTVTAWEQQVVTNEAGQTEVRRLPATSIVPADTVIFVIEYANTGADPADDVLITNPVPEHMQYVEDSARGENTVISFSVDGGRTYLPRAALVVAAGDSTRPATQEDITHINWALTVPVAPGAAGTVEYRAILE